MHLLQKEGIACEQEENDFPGQKEQPHGTAKLGLKIFLSPASRLSYSAG